MLIMNIWIQKSGFGWLQRWFEDIFKQVAAEMEDEEYKCLSEQDGNHWKILKSGCYVAK